MAFEPVIQSLLDTDLYKFTMWQPMLHRHPQTRALYRFVLRNEPGYPLAELLDEVNAQLDHLCSLYFRREELDFLGSLRFMKPDFIDFLRIFHFQRDFIPFGSRRTIFTQSSYQPIAPKPIITASTTHTYLLRRSAHSSTDASTVSRISAPPMVGVPALVKCVCGPSVRIGWPLNSASLRIIAGPHHSDSDNAVSALRMPRKVR